MSLEFDLQRFDEEPETTSEPQSEPQEPIPEELDGISEKITQAIKAEAMNMSGFSEDDVASLEYADDDDPRINSYLRIEHQTASPAEMLVVKNY